MNRAVRFSFDGSGLDRAAHLRGQAPALLQQAGARVLPIWRGKPLLIGESAEGRAEALGWVSPETPGLHGDALFLGMTADGPRFVQDISAWEPPVYDTEALDRFTDQTEQVHPDMPEGSRFAELRTVLTRLTPLESELVAVARALTQWHGSHGFCAKCGTRSEVEDGGWQRACPSCGTRHFPRTDPVVIMLITRGNSVLIGRNTGWPDGMYSLLAGFVEPGETPEDAVRREVVEETGVDVGPVRYLASQPWPFPTQLMMAFAGEAVSEAIRIDPNELDDARWVSREDMAVILRGDNPQIFGARRGSIARAVLDAWVEDRLGSLSGDRNGPWN